jgi:hypothetical protein
MAINLLAGDLFGLAFFCCKDEILLSLRKERSQLRIADKHIAARKKITQANKKKSVKAQQKRNCCVRSEITNN